jgi:hypothetical protein
MKYIFVCSDTDESGDLYDPDTAWSTWSDAQKTGADIISVLKVNGKRVASFYRKNDLGEYHQVSGNPFNPEEVD